MEHVFFFKGLINTKAFAIGENQPQYPLSQTLALEWSEDKEGNDQHSWGFGFSVEESEEENQKYHTTNTEIS